MVENFRTLIVASLITGLFLFSMISLVIQMSTDNEIDAIILQNENINRTFSQLGGNLSNAQGVAQSQRLGFESEVPTVGTNSFLFESIIGAGKVFTGMWRNIYDITFGLLSTTLGVDPIIIGTLISILLIIIVLLAWSLYKIGR